MLWCAVLLSVLCKVLALTHLFFLQPVLFDISFAYAVSALGGSFDAAKIEKVFIVRKQFLTKFCKFLAVCFWLEVRVMAFEDFGTG